MSTNRRRSNRQQLKNQKDSLVHLRHNGEVLEGRIADLSMNGFKLELSTPKPLEPSTAQTQPVTGSMWIKHLRSAFEFTGRIVWATPKADDGDNVHALGFEFAAGAELPSGLVAALLSDDLAV